MWELECKVRSCFRQLTHSVNVSSSVYKDHKEDCNNYNRRIAVPVYHKQGYTSSQLLLVTSLAIVKPQMEKNTNHHLMAGPRKSILSDLMLQALAFFMSHSTPKSPHQNHLSPTVPSCAGQQPHSLHGFWGTGKQGRQQCLQGLRLPYVGIFYFS